MWTPELIARARAYLTGRGLVNAGMSDDQVIEIAEAEQARAFSAVGLDGEATRAGGTARPLDFSPATLNEDERTIEVTLATEAPVVMFDYRMWDYVDEILPMSGFDASAVRGDRIPLLDTHQRRSVANVLGSLTSLRVEGSELAAVSQFSAVEEAAFTKAREGHLDGISVGYRVESAIYVEPGESAEVNGRTWTAGERMLKIAQRWIPAEGSLCPIGADPNCGTRASAAPTPSPTQRTTPTNPSNQSGETPMLTRETIIANLTGRGYTQEAAEHWAGLIMALDEGQRQSTLDALPAISAQRAPAPAPIPAPTPAPAAAPAADPTRAQQFVVAERQIRAQFPNLQGIDALVDEYVSDATRSADGLLAEALRRSAANRPSIVVTQDQSDHTRANMTNAILLRSGSAAVQNLTADDRQRGQVLRGYTLYEMARHCLEQNGVRTQGMDPMELVGRAFTHTTGDFPLALQNAANVSLLAAYASAPNIWRAWCDVVSLSDFKSAPLVRVSEAGLLEKTPDGSPIKEHSLDDNQETIQLATYSKIIGIGRQAVINDNLGIFSQIPAKHARAWARTINQLCIKVLLTNGNLSDGTALFAAGHSNLDTSTAKVTDAATAQAVIRALSLKIEKQMDQDGKSQLNLMPSLILTSPELAKHYRQAIGETGRADNNAPVDIRGMNLQVLSDGEISNSTLTGNGSNITYALANPMDAPVVAAGFLNGNDQPRMETQNGFNIEGVQLRVSGDTAAAAVGYRGGAKHVK